MSDIQPETKILHIKTDIHNASPSVTPLFQNSAFESTSPHFYTRKSNPNTLEFEETIRTLEDAEYAVSVTTGMTALSLAMNLLKPRSKLLINKDIYGCTYKLCRRIAEKRDISLQILDLSMDSEHAAIKPDTDMVIFETPTNPYLKTIDIAKLSARIKNMNRNALIVVDNTWATSIFQKPLKHGADISLHSATKYFSGHSDVMGGILLTDSKKLADELYQERFYTGAILDPHSAWLLRRSLQTLHLRLNEHERTTKILVEYVASLPQVARVYYPKTDGKQLTGYGGIIFFELREDLKDKYESFRDSLKIFGTGTGMACVTSMVAQPYTGSHASLTEEEKTEMGLSKKLVRLCFGFENIEDIKHDISNALEAIDKS